jgi:phage baseplate assembly protein W
MAYRAPSINPIDVGQQVAIGVPIPFNSPQVFTQTYTTSEQVKSNLINFILTAKGERPLNPEFGTTIRQYLFENITNNTLRNLEDSLREELTLNFPSVTITNINFNPQYDTNAINIIINYYILGGNPNTLNITI